MAVIPYNRYDPIYQKPRRRGAQLDGSPDLLSMSLTERPTLGQSVDPELLSARPQWSEELLAQARDDSNWVVPGEADPTGSAMFAPEQSNIAPIDSATPSIVLPRSPYDWNDPLAEPQWPAEADTSTPSVILPPSPYDPANIMAEPQLPEASDEDIRNLFFPPSETDEQPAGDVRSYFLPLDDEFDLTGRDSSDMNSLLLGSENDEEPLLPLGTDFMLDIPPGANSSDMSNFMTPLWEQERLRTPMDDILDWEFEMSERLGGREEFEWVFNAHMNAQAMAQATPITYLGQMNHQQYMWHQRDQMMYAMYIDALERAEQKGYPVDWSELPPTLAWPTETGPDASSFEYFAAAGLMMVGATHGRQLLGAGRNAAVRLGPKALAAAGATATFIQQHADRANFELFKLMMYAPKVTEFGAAFASGASPGSTYTPPTSLTEASGMLIGSFGPDLYENRQELVDGIFQRAEQLFQDAKSDDMDTFEAYGRGVAMHSFINSLNEEGWRTLQQTHNASDEDWAALRQKLQGATVQELDAALRPTDDDSAVSDE